jgi:hypothetical protein
MAVEIFHCIGDQSVLAERDHDIGRAEDEVRSLFPVTMSDFNGLDWKF